MYARGDASATVENATARLEHWLCEGPAVMRSGPQSGAVTGRLTLGGCPDYAYPEIAGYYLTWLSFLHRTGQSTDLHHDLANGIVDWVIRWADTGMQTRVQLHRLDANDWRNNAIFLFDLTMLLRGVTHALESGLAGSSGSQAASRRLVGQIATMRDPAGGLCCLSLRGGEIPDRWSTQSGPFLLKALASLIGLGNGDAMFQPLKEAALATLPNILPGRGQAVHPECDHAALYFVEGVLLARESGVELAPAEAHCQEILNRHLIAFGDDTSRWAGRHDVLAQWLRSAILIFRGREDAEFAMATRRAAQQLALSVADDGGLPFERSGTDVSQNTWCAMFAHQALWLFTNSKRGHTDLWPRALLV